MLALSMLAVVAASSTLHKYDGLALNADASRIASVEATRAEGATVDAHASVVVRDADGAIVATLDPCADCRYYGPAWSPDGKRLAFVATHAGKTAATLFVVDDLQPAAIAEIAGDAGLARWSPDGRSIALLVTPDAQKAAGATQPGVRRIGEIDDAHDARRIAIFDAATGAAKRVDGSAPHFVSPERTFVYEYDWRPDGRGFVGTAAEGNGDNNWWIAKLEAFDLDGGIRVIASPREQMNIPRVSPDGRRVAYIGGRMSDFGSVGGDVFVVPIEGGTPVDVTPSLKGSFTSIAWQGDRIVGTIVVGGSVGQATVDVARRRVSAVSPLAGSVSSGEGAVNPERSGSGLALDASGRIAAYAVESFERPPHIEYGPLGDTHAITHDNDALPAKTAARSVAWRNDGLDVQGWLLSPIGAEAAAADGSRSPMITIVHGGPSGVVTPRYLVERMTSDLLAKGYYVFMPNPRGSFGNGTAFANANYRAFGRGDFRDILSGVDAVEKIAPIDERRLGIFGHSYGGFMTMWAVTHTSRFKAAVAGAGVANWVSYYGQNGIDQWMTPFFGATMYDDPGIYDALSPIRTIKAATTPTLIYVGERDIEVPAAQSEEFWHGLRAVGVPTSLVIYEGEGHRIRSAEHQADLNGRAVAWFDRWLGRTAAPVARR